MSVMTIRFRLVLTIAVSFPVVTIIVFKLGKRYPLVRDEGTVGRKM